MQIFALDTDGNAVEASKAHRHTDYACLECGSPLRVRRSPFLVPHYYHYKTSPNCAQRRKSLTHLNLQIALKDLLGARMEVPFPEIRRIADVLHGDTVFEIQVSPISKEEVEARINDYRSLNLKVVWLLYDRTFNQPFISNAEQFLAGHPHYFTDGKRIYDQLSLFHKRHRLHRLFRREVDLSRPHAPVPKFGRSWDLSFENDILASDNFRQKEKDLLNSFQRPKRNNHFLVNVWRYLLLKSAK